MLKSGLVIGLVSGLCAPVVATVLTMLFFDTPSGRGVEAYWTAVAVLCPGWGMISSPGTFVAISILDGIIYAVVAMAVVVGVGAMQRAD